MSVLSLLPDVGFPSVPPGTFGAQDVDVTHHFIRDSDDPLALLREMGMSPPLSPIGRICHIYHK